MGSTGSKDAIDIPVRAQLIISHARSVNSNIMRPTSFDPSALQLADMGEHQLTIRDYLRHSNLNVTNKYLQATCKNKRTAQGKLVDAILPTGILSQSKINPDPMKHSHRLMKAAQDISCGCEMGVREGVGALIVPKCTQIDWTGLVNLLKRMVGTRRLELLTSTVSR
jgi:hypothetical protein